MKNKDLLAMQKAKIVEEMNQAIKDGNTEAFSNAFVELCEKIEDNVMQQAKELVDTTDSTVLAQRGVRQLTSKEKNYYNKIIEAMRSDDPKQALNNAEVTMPETIINSVFEDLKAGHPLLEKLNATTVTGLTRMMMNTTGEQKAAWGALTAKIIEELSAGFKEVDVTQDKLSAFIPISKAMLDLGATWLDKYVRTVLQEALANGLEYGIVRGTGKDEPIGMMMQVGEEVKVLGGVYPEKTAVKITAMDMEQMGNVTALLARDAYGKARAVSDLIMLVNPIDYFKKVLPATKMLTPDGVYASSLPVPAEIIQSAAVPEGKAVYGIAKKYFLGVGMQKNGKIEYSDQYRFLEDQRVYLIKLYANGFAVDNNAFIVLDITSLQPLRYKVITKEDAAKVDNAELADIKIGGVKLNEEFAGSTTTYTATTTKAKSTIKVVPAHSTAEYEITTGKGVTVSNGSAVNWDEGSNTITIHVADGAATKDYTITITKE